MALDSRGQANRRGKPVNGFRSLALVWEGAQMSASKNRVPIPDDMATEVLFLADRTCCVCHQSGKQVQLHHIDEDPSHNEVDNLAVLCLECHAQTQFTGGFGRKLNAGLVRRYRAHWLSVVELRRNAEELRTEISREWATPASAPQVGSPFQGGVRIIPAPTSGPPPAQPSVHDPAVQDPATSLEMGEGIRTGGIVITLLDVHESESVRLNRSGYRAGSGFDILSDVKAGSGAKYVTVQTRVLNDGNESIDLTCGGPIYTHAIDDRGRKYDHIGELYDVPGNPECNVNLQPGFESDMTWIYKVPGSAVVTALDFCDISNLSVETQTVTVAVPF